MLKKQPTLHDQHAWAMKDSRSAHTALSAMLEQMYRGEVTAEDCYPFFDMCQRQDQKLLDIEAIIRREHIRTMDASVFPAPPPTPDLELNIALAIRYLTELKEKVS